MTAACCIMMVTSVKWVVFGLSIKPNVSVLAFSRLRLVLKQEQSARIAFRLRRSYKGLSKEGRQQRFKACDGHAFHICVFDAACEK